MRELHARWLALRAQLRERQLSAKEASSCFKRLSFLIASSMPLPRALELLATEAGGMSTDIVEHVIAGRSLADAMATDGTKWTPFAIAVVRAGESSGSLAANLAYLAEETAKTAALKARVIGALIYPCVIAMVASGLVIGLIAFIFPKILPLFASLGTSLPWSTRLLIALSTHASLLFGMIAALAIAAGFAHRAIQRQEAWRLRRDRALLLTPVLGPLLAGWQLSTVSRVLGTLLKAGLPLPAAIAAAAETAGNRAYRVRLVALRGAVEQGGGVSIELAKDALLFPRIATGMIRVGEASGSLPETFEALAAFYEAETGERTRLLSSLVEPAVMILMGLAIGFVAVSIIAPIYSISGHLHAR